LRRVCADAPAAIAPFADAVLLAGDFLSDLAWADSVDQVLLDANATILLVPWII
jgi:hypothetical protein